VFTYVHASWLKGEALTGDCESGKYCKGI